MRVKVLYFDGCPNHRPTVELVREVALEMGIDADIQEVEVKGVEEAIQLRFLGSPTVQVNGEDIDRVRSDAGYGMSCRMYGASGIPSREIVTSALIQGIAKT
jgi:hypothetical protein